jgi:hypothetical protein
MWPIVLHTFMIVCGKANVNIEQSEKFDHQFRINMQLH